MQFFSTPQAIGELQNLKSHLICYLLGAFTQKYSADVVSNRSELEQVCRILYRQYRKRNYCEVNSSRLHYSPYMFSKDSRTFALKKSDQILGTISIFPDSHAGIPCESLYSKELSQFRNARMKFAEVGLLALDLESTGRYSLKSPNKMLPLFMLFKSMFNYALVKELSHLVIVMHPKHQKLYNFFGFRQFAEVKGYPGACGNLAMPMILDTKARMGAVPPSLRKFFLSDLQPLTTFDQQLAESPNAYSELFGGAFEEFFSSARPSYDELTNFEWNKALAH